MSSPFWTIQPIPNAGRGVIASQHIAPGTTIHTANDLSAHVLLREYRGEVCWECFAYNRGKKLAIRDSAHGFTFCSTGCERTFTSRYDDVGMEAWAAVEKMKVKRQEVELEHISGDRPSASAVDEAWKFANKHAAAIYRARTNNATCKADKRALAQALSNSPTADTAIFQTHAILSHHNGPTTFLPSLLTLEADSSPYISPNELVDHITSYLHLTATLPLALLPLPDLRTVKQREVHNSFGIRSLDDAGAEFFGYGVWVSASWFNHSCVPNVVRRRVGRSWVFGTVREVGSGEELVISYLNGEEEELGVVERRERLKRTWGFECACKRCCGGG